MSASPADAAAPAAARPSRSDEVRRALLAVSVLDDLDVHHDDEALSLHVPGVARRGSRLRLPSHVAADVLGGWPPISVQARLRLRSWLRAHRAIAAAPHPGALLRERVRALAVPHGSAWHPGAGLAPRWTRAGVPGGALDVGLGVVGIDEGGAPVPLWPDLPGAAGMDAAAVDELWDSAGAHALRMGGIAAARAARASRSSSPPGGPGAVLRPYGGCDVPTLLATGPLRAELAGSDPVGMRVVSVPDRTRGWFDSRHADPAFVAAAWTATEPASRGVRAPLLVTSDEVALPR